MRILELIEKLKEIEYDHGNLTCCLCDIGDIEVESVKVIENECNMDGLECFISDHQ